MIQNCEAVFVDNKSAVQVWIHLLGCQKQAIFCEIACKLVYCMIRQNLLSHWLYSRSFFSSSFEPASYSLVGRLILNPNQPMILFDLLGLQRNLSKFEMNLPEIYLFSSPLLCLCVNFFCFVLFWKYQQIFPSIRTETHLFHWNIFHLLLFRISTLYRLRM